MADTSFRITDTKDGRYAVEDERGFVLEGLTKTQADRLKAYLLKLQADIDQMKRETEDQKWEARLAAAPPEDRVKMKANEMAYRYGLDK
jgi:hypothetical protein